MEPAFDPHSKKRASVYANDDFICIESSAGYRRTVGDKIIAFLSPEAADRDIGNAVLAALASYRVIPVAEHEEFFSLARVETRYAEWEREMLAKAGYKSSRNLYRGLKLVPVQLSQSELTVSGTVRDRRRGFSGNDFSLAVPVDSGAAAIGNAVKKALEECA